jgi:hypothetical protein
MNAVEYDPIPNKTYKTRENAEAAVKRAMVKFMHVNKTLRYMMLTDKDGRFFPVFIGQDAITAGVHFHFNVVG